MLCYYSISSLFYSNGKKILQKMLLCNFFSIFAMIVIFFTTNIN